MQKAATELGLRVKSAASVPSGPKIRLAPARIALWDRYGGSMPSGWTRWMFEQYEFPFEVVFPGTLDAGNLNAKYDVLVFVDGAIPLRDPAPGGGGGGFGQQPAADTIPAEFRPMVAMFPSRVCCSFSSFGTICIRARTRPRTSPAWCA